MIRRRNKRKLKLKRQAVAKGDEPPDPVTLTVIGVTGAVIGAAGTVFGAVAAKQSANQQSALAAANAQAERQNSLFQQSQAQYNAMIAKQQSDAYIGKERAALAASGADLSGSPLDLLSASASNAELQQQSIKASGQMEVNNSLFKAQGFDFQSRDQAIAGNTALTSGMISAGSQLASGLAGTFSNYNKMTKPGTY